jgi:hypothetical protein
MARAARAVREARELALDGVAASTTRPRRRAGRSGRATLRRLN